MIVRNQAEALLVAVEMERRAIRTYERALMMTEHPQVLEGIQDILADEQEHLSRFQKMQAKYPLDADTEATLIKSLGAEALMQGGLLEMVRQGALQSVRKLYMYAIKEERGAVAEYGAFADRCEDPAVAEAFRSIAEEESTHLDVLEERVREMDEA